MNAAETLREAAAKLREYAGFLELHSIRGPWSVHAGSTGYPQSVNNIGVPIHICDTFTGPQAPPIVANWIALMHPGVGVALADWLDEAAVRQDATERAAEVTWRNSDDIEARTRWVAGMTDQQALATARAVLGEARDDRA